jgi:hypothetical protein
VIFGGMDTTPTAGTSRARRQVNVTDSMGRPDLLVMEEKHLSRSKNDFREVNIASYPRP